MAPKLAEKAPAKKAAPAKTSDPKKAAKKKASGVDWRRLARPCLRAPRAGS
jgi:hypothetical protein